MSTKLTRQKFPVFATMIVVAVGALATVPSAPEASAAESARQTPWANPNGAPTTRFVAEQARKRSRRSIRNVSSTRKYPDMPDKPVAAYQRDSAKKMMSYGGFRQSLNSPEVISIFGAAESQKQMNLATQKCMIQEVGYGISSQLPQVRRGSKRLTVVSKNYEVDVFSLDSPTLAGWFRSCRDIVSASYTIVPVRRPSKRSKARIAGKGGQFAGYGNPQFDGLVWQRKHQASKLRLKLRVSDRALKKRLIGYKTTLITAPLPPFPGQTIFAQKAPKQVSWTNWIGYAKRQR